MLTSQNMIGILALKKIFFSSTHSCVVFKKSSTGFIASSFPRLSMEEESSVLRQNNQVACDMSALFICTIDPTGCLLFRTFSLFRHSTSTNYQL